LSSIASQDALILLRASFSAPKVLHLLRCSPSVSHPSLERFDTLLKQVIQCITNSVLSDLQWIQASLPVRDGGLGVRRVSSLARPAFLASAASTLSLQDDIVTECALCNSNFLQSCLADWSAKCGDVPDILPTKQPISDRPGALESKAKVEANNTPYHRASFLAASCQHSGDWLFALPIASCGLKLDEEAVRVAIGLRLGLDFCIPHQCHCGSPVDARGLLGRVTCPLASAEKHRAGRLGTMLSMTWSLKVLPQPELPVCSAQTGRDLMV